MSEKSAQQLPSTPQNNVEQPNTEFLEGITSSSGESLCTSLSTGSVHEIGMMSPEHRLKMAPVKTGSDKSFDMDDIPSTKSVRSALTLLHTRGMSEPKDNDSVLNSSDAESCSTITSNEELSTSSSLESVSKDAWQDLPLPSSADDDLDLEERISEASDTAKPEDEEWEDTLSDVISGDSLASEKSHQTKLQTPDECSKDVIAYIATVTEPSLRNEYLENRGDQEIRTAGRLSESASDDLLVLASIPSQAEAFPLSPEAVVPKQIIKKIVSLNEMDTTVEVVTTPAQGEEIPLLYQMLMSSSKRVSSKSRPSYKVTLLRKYTWIPSDMKESTDLESVSMETVPSVLQQPQVSSQYLKDNLSMTDSTVSELSSKLNMETDALDGIKEDVEELSLKDESQKLPIVPILVKRVEFEEDNFKTLVQNSSPTKGAASLCPTDKSEDLKHAQKPKKHVFGRWIRKRSRVLAGFLTGCVSLNKN